MKTKRILELGRLKDYLKDWPSVQCDFFAESCAAALEIQGHESGIHLIIEGDFQESFQVNWEYAINLRGWREPREIAENGAIAIAFFLIIELTDYKIVEQAVIGTGFDYWLVFKESNPKFDPDNFLNARLEVSGINKGGSGKIAQRIKQKFRQLGMSDDLNIPAYVIVTEFSKPISFILEK